MTTATPIDRRILRATVTDASAWRGTADVRIIGKSVTVTIDIPRFALQDLRWEVAPQSLVVSSRKSPAELHLSVPLEQPVQPGVFVVRVRGGVFDVRMELQ